MPPPAEVFSSLSCYLESTPLFLCFGLLHLFLLDFALLYTFFCPGLSTSEALYRLVASLNDSVALPFSDHDK